MLHVVRLSQSLFFMMLLIDNEFYVSFLFVKYHLYLLCGYCCCTWDISFCPLLKAKLPHGLRDVEHIVNDVWPWPCFCQTSSMSSYV